jgi:hypothetical protein
VKNGNNDDDIIQTKWIYSIYTFLFHAISHLTNNYLHSSNASNLLSEKYTILYLFPCWLVAWYCWSLANLNTFGCNNWLRERNMGLQYSLLELVIELARGHTLRHGKLSYKLFTTVALDIDIVYFDSRSCA